MNGYIYHIFIAYSAKDSEIALQLYRILSLDYSVFLDSESLLPGDYWDVELNKAQQKSLITAVLISSNIDDSYYQQEEITAAIDLSRNTNNKHRVVPIYLNMEATPNNIPYGLRRLHGVFMRKDTPISEVANELKRVLLNMSRIQMENKIEVICHTEIVADGKMYNKKDDEIIRAINLMRKRCEINHDETKQAFLSLVYVDVDGLTHINKIYGRVVADEVIKIIEKYLSELVYHVTRIARTKEHYFAHRGEDEFLFCLKGDYLKALSFGEMIRDYIKSYHWASIAPELHVTISVGIVQLDQNIDTVDGIIRAYFGSIEAKKYGGNKVILGPLSLPKKISRNLRDYGSY